MKPDIILFLCDARGIYIPRDFAKSIKVEALNGVTTEDLDLLRNGPDEELYWDVWTDVIDNVTVEDKGVTYFLYQDGDLWLIPKGMEWNDERDCWEWPFEGVSFTGPACWASYLVNGDATGLSDEEREECDRAHNGLGNCVDAIEIGFVSRPDYGLAGDCCEFRFM